MNPDNIDPRMFLDMNSKQLKEWANSQTADEILAAVRAIYAEMGRLQEEILEEIDQEMQDEDQDLSEATAVINRIRAM
jgi:DNA anti-recombination protein RmuC